MLRVRLFHARQSWFEGHASMVVLPATGGEVSILPYHAPMLCVLEAGDVHVDEARFRVQRGLACVSRNAVTILTE